jgi:hypothetical protein
MIEFLKQYEYIGQWITFIVLVLLLGSMMYNRKR